MASDFPGGSARDRRDLARQLIRQYGRVRGRLKPRPGWPIQAELVISMVGSFSSTTMARYLDALVGIVPPQYVSVRVARRRWARVNGGRAEGYRPMVWIAWRGARAEQFLDAIGWDVRPDDARLRAWQRWRMYREASGAWQAAPSGTSSRN